MRLKRRKILFAGLLCLALGFISQTAMAQTIEHSWPCGACNGTGVTMCLNCGGMGQVTTIGWDYTMFYTSCPNCWGSGRATCNFCGGKGEIIQKIDPTKGNSGNSGSYNNSYNNYNSGSSSSSRSSSNEKHKCGACRGTGKVFKVTYAPSDDPCYTTSYDCTICHMNHFDCGYHIRCSSCDGKGYW